MFERLLVFGVGNEEHLIFERLLVFGIEDEENWSLRDCCCCCLVFWSLHSLKSNLNFFLRILQKKKFVGFAVQESSIFEAIVAAAVVGCCWRIFNPWGSCYCCWVLKSRLWQTLRDLVVVVGLEIVICVQKKKKNNNNTQASSSSRQQFEELRIPFPTQFVQQRRRRRRKGRRGLAAAVEEEEEADHGTCRE